MKVKRGLAVAVVGICYMDDAKVDAAEVVGKECTFIATKRTKTALG